MIKANLFYGSHSLVDRIQKENKKTVMFMSSQTVERGPYTSTDGLNQAAIKYKITEFYSVRNQLPTLRTLSQVLTEDIKFPLSLQKMTQWINKPKTLNEERK